SISIWKSALLHLSVVSCLIAMFHFTSLNCCPIPPHPHILPHFLKSVWGRSFCRTMEKLVEVVQEYPTEVEHIYSPSCVPLVRCAGCCGDENLECHPTETSNVTMQMTFVEHKTCECR
uniref:Placental growth factor b n=1 Tax=Xiphophorus couchianus TaxID=32473 RepID=A0A3B5LKQ2_9TELE